jgi:glycosyltransferase involved in cell wall biosynthesis
VRILLYTSSRAWTGSARAFEAAAHGLAGREHQVTFVCPPESEVEQRLRYGSYEALPVAESGSFLFAVWRLRRVLTERKVDVIFTTTESEHLAALAAARSPVRTVLVRRVAHGAASGGGWRSSVAARFGAPMMMAGSDDEANLLRTRFARAVTAIVPLGVDVFAADAVRPIARSSFGIEGDGGLIACVYDPSARTRVASVLRVLGRLAPRHPELRMVLIGHGSTNEDLRMHAAALRITRAVSFLGQRDDHLAVLRAADLGWVVAGGDDAAFGMLDLMALKVPVIAERSSLSRQYVADGIAGLLLPFDDAGDTAAAVARLLAQVEERAAMGSAGRTRAARDFGEVAMVDGFERAAEAALEHAEPAPMLRREPA